MHQNIYSDDIDNDNSEINTYHEVLFFPIILFLLIVSLMGNLYLFLTNKRTIEKINKTNVELVNHITDSLNNELEFSQTQVELKTIHEIYGQILISKEKVQAPNVDDVWDFITKLDTWYPEYIIAQAIIESSCGEYMPHKSNNMFGMMVPRKRESVAINKNTEDTYAKYRNWKECVIDRVLWELYVFDYNKPTEEEYINKLKSYATSENYIESVKSVAKRYK